MWCQCQVVVQGALQLDMHFTVKACAGPAFELPQESVLPGVQYLLADLRRRWTLPPGRLVTFIWACVFFASCFVQAVTGGFAGGLSALY